MHNYLSALVVSAIHFFFKTSNIVLNKIDTWFLGLSVIASFLAIFFELRKYNKQREDNKIASIRNSLIDIKSRLLKYSYKLNETFYLELDTICFLISKEINNHLNNLTIHSESEKEFIKTFFQKDLQRYLKCAIRSRLSTCEVGTVNKNEIDKIEKIPSSYEFDMPLITGIMNDCLIILKSEIDFFTLDYLHTILFPEEEYCEQHKLVTSLKSISDLEHDDLDTFCKKITLLLIKEAETKLADNVRPVSNSIINIIFWLINILLSLPDKQLKYIKEWDSFQFPIDTNLPAIERLTLAWTYLKEILGDELAVSVFIEIKHVLKASGYYSVSLINEVHLDYVWLKGKGKRVKSCTP